jgi:hypothetical protein
MKDEKEGESGFRGLYGPAGPGGYYREHGDDYTNPHEPAVAAALAHAVARWARRPDGLDFSRVLDLAAGGGEATLALARLVPACVIDGLDPYTHRLYQRRTGRPCLPVSFEEIARGDHPLAGYSCVVSSCALHLAEDSWLPPLCLALAAAARDLLVITPLTRPEVRQEWGWRLMEATSCAREERSVRLRWYRSTLA